MSSDYLTDLEKIESKIIDIVTNAENQEIYLLKLIDKASTIGIGANKAMLRDAVIAAAGRKKLKIEKRAPKQLMVRLLEKK